MNQTPHFQLNQWELSDRILMEDFNADNVRIEAAIRAAQTEAASGLKIKTGTFTGTGSTGTRTYSIGVKPQLLVVYTDHVNSEYGHDKGLLATEIACVAFTNSGTAAMGGPGSPCTLLDDGFSIRLNGIVDRGLDYQGSTLHYWALYWPAE